MKEQSVFISYPSCENDACWFFEHTLRENADFFVDIFCNISVKIYVFSDIHKKLKLPIPM